MSGVAEGKLAQVRNLGRVWKTRPQDKIQGSVPIAHAAVPL